MKIGRIFLSFYFVFILSLPVHAAETSENHDELSMIEKQKLIIEAALEYGIPPEILKAISFLETDMQQFNNGEPWETEDGRIGIMKVKVKNTDFQVDENKLKYDTSYNIETGAKALKRKWNMQFSGQLPKINDGNPRIIENWYFAIMAYNGLSKVNDPNQNEYPYQEKVFDYIEKNSGVDLIDIPEVNIDYDDEDKLIFKKMKYQWDDAKAYSTQMFKKNDQVYIMNTNNPYYFNYTNLREEPRTGGPVIKRIPYYTKLTIAGGPFVDTSDKFSPIVYYKVTGDDVEGFVSSSNLRSIDQLNTSFYQWDEGKHQEVAKDKIWSIKMSVPLQGSSVHPRNVYITDENGNGVFTKVSYHINENWIKVEPREEYEPGESYTLHVENIQSSDGIVMQQPVALNFTIKVE